MRRDSKTMICCGVSGKAAWSPVRVWDEGGKRGLASVSLTPIWYSREATSIMKLAWRAGVVWYIPVRLPLMEENERCWGAR